MLIPKAGTVTNGLQLYPYIMRYHLLGMASSKVASEKLLKLVMIPLLQICMNVSFQTSFTFSYAILLQIKGAPFNVLVYAITSI